GLGKAETRVSSVDFAYLERFLSGDRAIVAEVLELFRRQGDGWLRALGEAQANDGDRRALAHTIKGAARGIGANALGEACDTAEFGSADDLPAVRRALLDALAEIAAYLEAAQL